ncbi:hypothetical protein Syncc8109_2458 [Synechococcus sp. WH 8109]|nr:hypothetical protein Syncc8109_2458 [Synechococcus sp. WH 8109]
MAVLARMLRCCCRLDGRCSSIDAVRGCIRFELKDEPQDPFCIA